jgi:pre-mRNA-splicing factor CDC5/CEF1
LLAEGFGQAWEKAHERGMLPGLAGYAEDEIDEHQLMTEAFDVSTFRSPQTIIY